jgi:hypothetical protein
MVSRSSQYRPDVLEQLLGPLKEGRQVVLSVKDIRLPKKSRRYCPVLALTPYVQGGCPQGYLLVSMPPYGSELVDPKVDLKPSVFARLGLSFSLAKAVANALQHVLLGE